MGGLLTYELLARKAHEAASKTKAMAANVGCTLEDDKTSLLQIGHDVSMKRRDTAGTKLETPYKRMLALHSA